MTFNGRFVANLIQFGAIQGVQPQPLYDLTGHSKEELLQEGLRLSKQVYNQICQRLYTESKNPAFGLHVGSYWTLPAAGLVAQVIQTSRTVGEGMQFLCEFSNLGCSSLPFSLHKSRDYLFLSVAMNEAWYQQAPEVLRHTLEGLLLFNLQGFRSLTHDKVIPLRLSLPYPRTSVPRSVYEGFFKCPVAFNQEEIFLQFPASVGNLPILTADYRLLQVLVRHAQEKSGQLEEGGNFPNWVQQVLYQLMGNGFPQQEAVAETLHISPRTLQRRLREVGTNYKQIVDQVKQELAFDYLRNPQLTIQMISDLLDYAEPSVFSRSFRRWTNQSPRAYRQTILEK